MGWKEAPLKKDDYGPGKWSYPSSADHSRCLKDIPLYDLPETTKGVEELGNSLDSRNQNWGPCKTSLRTLSYGSRTLCGKVAWLVLVTVSILVKEEVR
jgi:hypothetical protein